MVFNAALALFYTQFANENANGAAPGKLEFTCININTRNKYIYF